VRDALPHIDLGVDASSNRALDVAAGIIQWNFVIADMDADWRQADEVDIEG